MKYDYLLKDLYNQAKTTINTCGILRCYQMASITSSLVEIIHLLKMQSNDPDGTICDDLQPQDLQEMGQQIEEIIDAATIDHAMLVSNCTDSTACDVHPIHTAQHGSAIQTSISSAIATEKAIYQTIRQNVLDIPSVSDRVPFPLCEMAIQLSVEIKKTAEALARQMEFQQATHQRHLAEDNEPQLQTYISRTIDAGLMTRSGQWEANVTRSQIAYWVNLAARRLNIARHWKWAQERWGIINLAQEQNRNNNASYITHRRLIDQIFA